MRLLTVLIIYLLTVFQAATAATLIGEWYLDEGIYDSGLFDSYDNTGNGYHIAKVGNNTTLEFTTPVASGYNGTCGYASLNNGALSSKTTLPLDTTTSGVKTTVTLWMKWDGTDNVHVIGWYEHSLMIKGGSIGFSTTNNDIYGTSSSGLSAGWNHLAVEFTNGSVTSNRLYINGVSKTLTQRTGSPNNSKAFTSSSMDIGRISANAQNFFHGLIDEVRLYDGALSTTEIANAKNARHDCYGYSENPSPILEFRLEESTWDGTADEIVDSSGNDNHGQIVAGSTPELSTPALTGDPGTCGYASQTAGAIQVTNLPLSTSRNGRKTTVTFWMNWDGTNGVMVLGWYLLYVGLFNGNIEFGTANSDYFSVSSAGLANGWHHIAVEFTNGSTINNSLHIDGVKQTLTMTGTPDNSRTFVDREMRIGGWRASSSYRFQGLVDEVRVFDTILSTAQVVDIMNERHPCSEVEVATLVAEYRLDESTWNGTANEIIDSSGNGYHGQVLANSTPESTTPALALSGGLSTCGYANQDDGEIQITGLPLDTTTTGVKTTVTFWMNWDGTNNVIPIGWHGHGIWFYLGSVGFNSGNADIYGVSSSGLAGGWHHIAVEFTNGSVTDNNIYIDGVKQVLTQQRGSPDNSQAFVQSELRIGGWTAIGSYEFYGLIDEVRVYQGALSTTEVVDIMNERHECPDVMPLAEFRLDESTWNGTANEIIDSSGNGYHGQVLANSTPESTTPALALSGGLSTCGYANQDDGEIQITGLPLDTTTTGVKTTVTFWMNWDGTNSVMPIGWHGHSIWFYLGSVGFNSGNADIYGVSSSGLAGGWHHIAVEFTNGSVTDNNIYIDGVKQVLTQRRGSPDNSQAFVQSELRIGGWTAIGSYEFYGLIDEVRVFQGALSTTQIVDIMNERHECPVVPVLDHFEIQHDGQGFTCEAKPITIKACVNANCDTLYDQETTITLSPSGWNGGNTLTFTGQLSTTLSVTDEGTITLAKVSASPDVDLRCFNGASETCNIMFSDDGFEIYGADPGDALPDQLSASNFSNVNLRAVRSNNNVCEALLEGAQNITLSYDCVTPNQCLTQLNGINIAGDGTGANSGNINVVFNNQGVASLGVLNYPDAGRLSLSVEAVVDGITIDNSGNQTVDVYPSYLELSVAQTELVYGDPNINQNNYVAGEYFTFNIGAYGVNDALLPNYQAETGTPQLKVTRLSPASLGQDGTFKYSDSGSSITSTSASFNNASGLNFMGGIYSNPLAYYTEVGRITIEARDTNYLGNTIQSNIITLGDFYPAYFDVELTQTPSLAHTCNNTFSYLGQAINFETAPEFTITAYNALGAVTSNYSDTYWNYSPTKPTQANLSFTDSSSYAATDSIGDFNLGDTPVIANNTNYDGSGTVTLNNNSVRYNKAKPNDSMFTPVSPFAAQLDMAFSSNFFGSTFTDQNGDVDTICYQADHTDSSCLGYNINGVTGTTMRFGRLVLESTYGPETEPLKVPIKTEYFNAGQWLLNTDDSFCTDINFSKADNEIKLSNTTFANSFSSVVSTGVLMQGVANGDQFTLDAPGTPGEMNIWLDPTDANVTWPTYLNYDWNGDGDINDADYPEATVTFGLFRGNDKIIQWREVYN